MVGDWICGCSIDMVCVAWHGGVLRGGWRDEWRGRVLTGVYERVGCGGQVSMGGGGDWAVRASVKFHHCFETNWHQSRLLHGPGPGSHAHPHARPIKVDSFVGRSQTITLEERQ